MHQTSTSIRQSPFVFIMRISVAELIFSIVLLFIAASAAVQLYEQTDAADVVSFPLLLALAIALLQIVIVLVTFVGWYFPVYRLTPGAILLRGGPFTQERPWIDASSILQVEVREGWLGRRLGYGTILISGRDRQSPLKMRNVQDPQLVAELVRELIREETTLPALLDSPLPALVASGEGEYIEFKASLMWDYRKQAVNKELYEPVMKNLVGFMNGKGGMLLIGIDDEGAVLGIEPDMKTLRKPGVDGFENVFNVAFSNMIGMEYRPFITLAFPVLEDKTICAIGVRPSSHPAYLHYQGKEEFYLRTGNSSNALGVSSAVQYIQGRFG